MLTNSFPNKRRNFILISFLLIFISCTKSQEIVPIVPVEPVNSSINLSHFNHLYGEVDLKGEKVGIVHIYSEYPVYEFITATNEGFTCVDDVARSIVMLSKYMEVYGSDANTIERIKKLTKFVLDMQNENGYFNNFLQDDLSINKTYPTSLAELDWWSLRALWGLETAYPLVKSDAVLAQRIEDTSQKLMVNIKRDISTNNSNTEFINGIETPTWLLHKSAADQSSLLIVGLLKNYERTQDNEVVLLINSLAKGIMVLQKGDADNYPYSAFLSYENLWHAWGNMQSYALLKAGQGLNKQEYIDSALKEINNFYPKILKSGFAEAFSIKFNGTVYQEIERKKYPQIAYGIRPMVWATAEAYRYSKKPELLTLTKNLASWITGKNDANRAIYNPITGVCFDGIGSPSEINKNSGAESTIEALLVLLEIEKLK